MRTLKRVYFELVEVQFIPEVEKMEAGKVYYSKEYNVTNHLCPCGCGTQTPLPIKEGEWSLVVSKGRITISPSIQHRYNCKSHYVITDGHANVLNHPIPKEEWNIRHGFDDSQPGE
jgi:hypothetical protein